MDAEILMASALGLRRLDLYTRFDRPMAPSELDLVRERIRRRGQGEPVAYIVGEREFFSLVFAVRPGVLVPRPETEHLVEAALAHLERREDPVFADVGTGSGCVAVSVLHGVAGARAHATDVSSVALEVARENARRHGVEARLTLHEGDLLAPLVGHPDHGRLDAVLSNPPYVVRSDPDVHSEVRAHEPPEAVFVAGDDPLEVAGRLAAQARDALAPGGLLAFEVGAGSAQRACELLERLGYVDVTTVKDLAKIERIVKGRRRG